MWSEVIESAWTESIWVLYIAVCLSESEGFGLTKLRHFRLLCLWSYMVIFHKNSLHFKHKKKSPWINRRSIFVNLQPLQFFPPISLFTLIPRLLRRGLLPCALTQYSLGLKGQSAINITEQWRLRHLSSAELNIYCVHLWRTKVSISAGYVHDWLLYADMAIMKLFPIFSILNGFLRIETLKLGCSRTAALFTMFGSMGATHFHLFPALTLTDYLQCIYYYSDLATKAWLQ